ncbi:MAG: heterodisulfide reductase-related iron-sulfur binding cluster [Chloroflexota bacterium]|nr:heterodisulfide reductase-related iron-sulfur binding cluster [Chloroflexota bacterium]
MATQLLELRNLAPPRQGFDGRDRPSNEIIDACVRCGFCLTSCPTYVETRVETSSPRGRIYLMKAVSEGRLDVTSPGFVHQMYECLDCRACEAVCPSGVQYGKLVEPARDQVERHVPRPPLQRLARAATFKLLFKDMRLFRLVSHAFRLYQRSGLQWAVRRSGVLGPLGLEETESLLPRMSGRFFVPEGQVYPAAGERRARVAMFAGCVMSTAFARVERATARVLARNGCEVVVPPAQGCCGALTVHGGDLEAARAMMRANIAAFERLEDSGEIDAIIINAAGCGSTLKEYGHLLHDDPEWAGRAAAFSAKVRDVSEFLAEIGLTGELGEIRARATYQDACHLAHAQRITKQPRQLLAAIPGLQLVEMTESSLCCGSAGVYNITNPEMSGRLMERKVRHALDTEPEIVVSANPGCMLQIATGLRRAGAAGVKVKHVVELLDESYRRAEGPRTRHRVRPSRLPAASSVAGDTRGDDDSAREALGESQAATD